MTRRDLTRIRAVHLARLDRARRVDSSTGEQVGAPSTLISLGTYLYAVDAITDESEAEAHFDMHGCYRAFAVPAMRTGHREEGGRFARAIIDDLRHGGDGISVRCPAVGVERLAMRRAA